MTFLISWLSYLLKSKNLHGIHSPFVYSLAKDVIYKSRQISPEFKAIEKLRSNLKKDNSFLSGKDYGAGSLSKRPRKTIGQFARSSSKPAKYAKLLYRLAMWRQPKYALEFGTALGISAAYQALGFGQETRFISLEGNAVLAEKAHKNLESLNFKNVQIIEGDFDKTLPNILEKHAQLDWVFFDGNHKKEATLRYFEQCLEKASDKALFIFDDINWSAGMQEAWAEIKQHPKVTLTIDLFFLGLVFFEKRPQKEDFVVRF